MAFSDIEMVKLFVFKFITEWQNNNNLSLEQMATILKMTFSE